MYHNYLTDYLPYTPTAVFLGQDLIPDHRGDCKRTRNLGFDGYLSGPRDVAVLAFAATIEGHGRQVFQLL